MTKYSPNKAYVRRELQLLKRNRSLVSGKLPPALFENGIELLTRELSCVKRFAKRVLQNLEMGRPSSLLSKKVLCNLSEDNSTSDST